MTNLSVFNFKSSNIRFEKRDGRVWVNLTDMAKASGKLVGNWNELKSTKEFLTELEGIVGTPIIKSKAGGVSENQGSWAIEEVAEKFRQWCLTPKKDLKTRKGVIYVFVDNANNAFKVGFTIDLIAREKQHKTSNPFLELVKEYPVDSIDIETILHEKLAKYRIAGTTEWYKKTPLVLKITSLVCSSN